MRSVSVLTCCLLPLLAACEVTVKSDDNSETNPSAELPAAQANSGASAASPALPAPNPATPMPPAFQNLRFLVDISDRELRLFDGDRLVDRYPVAVGTKKWPTPVGEWMIHQVDMNPVWVPPKDESWAEDADTAGAGARDNPMGRARLVYRKPNSIHGTDDLNSVGTAASHGSIRVANDVVLHLARTLLQSGGAWRGDQWFEQMASNRAQEFEIPLRKPVPIVVQD